VKATGISTVSDTSAGTATVSQTVTSTGSVAQASGTSNMSGVTLGRVLVNVDVPAAADRHAAGTRL
jgi:hypothetical protein